MRPSFYMQEPVDKQIQDEFALAHAVSGSLLFSLGEADDDLAAVRIKRVGEDVGNVVLAA